MAKAQKSLTQLEKLSEFVDGLSRHRAGRIALHIRVSALERPFHESFYKQKVAFTLRNLIKRFPESQNFTLPNHDSIIIVCGAGADDIEPSLMQIRRDLSESSIIRGLDPIVGVSDQFIGWYPLEGEYQTLKSLIGAMEVGGDSALATVAESSVKMTAHKSLNPTGGSTPKLAGKSYLRIETIKRTDAGNGEKKTALDAPRLRQLTDALASAEISKFVRHQGVKAMTKVGQSVPVFSNYFVSLEAVADALMPSVDLEANLWLKGYLQEFLSQRLLATKPKLAEVSALAVSIHVSAANVMGPDFDAFHESLGKAPRSKFIIEMSISEMLEAPIIFAEARNKLQKLGFKICLSDIAPEAVGMLNPQALKADFIKIFLRDEASLAELDAVDRRSFIEMVQKLGAGRVILDGCASETSIKEGLSLTLNLFQGAAIN